MRIVTDASLLADTNKGCAQIFVKNVIGNIYEESFTSSLQQRNCPNESCGCHIGDIHLDELNQYDVYKNGLMERVPG